MNNRRDHEPRTEKRGRSLVMRAALAATATSIAFAPRAASAQLDVNPPIPNVMLLVDTSGSMENMIDGSAPEDNTANKCVPNTTTPMNRWATLVSVLTGTIENYSCSAQQRDATFASEYGLSGNAPYDQGYYLPFHRILSHGCTIGPGTVPTNWWDWPATAFKQHDYSNVTTTCSTAFTQSNDGLLDTFRDRVRFGLMTFDTLPDHRTGIAGSGIDAAGGEAGMWSYFPGWNGGASSYAQGNPPNCAIHEYEVGARNAAAPPWEGRMIPFGPYDASLTNVEQTNDHVQQAILAMRPYGATPLAGMLTDAEYFLLNDPATDPSTTKPLSPKDDPYFDGGCRKTFIIVLSDGEPNMDMKPDCGKTGGVCPYTAPEQVARDLATNPDPNKRVQTYVVGFGLSTAGGFDCTQLTSADLTSPTCTTATGALKACCQLTAVAYNGGTSNAFFANDITGLRSQLSKVLAAISQGSTARTYPVFATASAAAGTGNAASAGFQFLSSFQAPAGGQLWSGNLERERYACQTTSGILAANLQNVDPTKGDDFAANLNSNDGNHPRQFFTFVGAADSTGKIYSSRSLRPGVITDDGLGLSTGTTTNNGLKDGPTFSSNLSATSQAFGIDPLAPPATCNSTLKTTAGTTCADRLMRWEIGVSNAPTLPDSRNPAGCPAGTTCSMFGSVYHATPVIMGAPLDFLQDESYSAFAQAQRLRETTLFTATTDGQLHAFKVAPGDPADSFKVDALQNNELWSFFPPIVLPSLLATYNQQSLLLDGAPILRDIVFERTPAQADAGVATWSTVLLAGGGAAGGFYYALDVTTPTAPKYLWQLSTDANNNPLFGAAVPQPAIATIAIKDTTGLTKEVAVAILPGGTAALKTGTCARQQSTWPKIVPTASYTTRGSVRCWGGATTVGPARSVTVVRLDTGEVLMNFRGNIADGPPGLPTSRYQITKLDSPMTGIPVAYPSQVGQVADRAYIGDADGTLWRIDFTNPDPTQWKMELAWDAYSMQTQFGDTAATGQPIQTTPIVSVDQVGNTVVLFSTGDQELFTTPTPITRVWSLTEKPNGTSYKTGENWVIPFTNGKRVTGPMSLFNSVLYFGTFTPNASGVVSCSDGFGSVWGVDYVLGDPQSYGKSPKPQFVADPINAPTVKTQFQDQPAGTVVFGVGVTQTPACVDDADLPGSLPRDTHRDQLGEHRLVPARLRDGQGRRRRERVEDEQRHPDVADAPRVDEDRLVGQHRGVRTAVAIACAALALAPGCKRKAADEPNGPVAAAPAATPLPVDRTAPNEVAEGTDDAFGLKLPRYMRITARFSDTMFAEGPLAPERVANYVRQRVSAKHVDTGPAKTVFTGAEPKGSPGKALRVEVLARPGSTEIMVRDETRQPPDPNMTPEDHMRAVGLKPDGTPLDPTHLR